MQHFFHAIPDEMKGYKQFVCWRFECRNGKLTKVPYNPITGKRASVVDPSTWSSFAEAVSAVENSPYYNGIGFVLTAYDPFVFIDLDDTQGDREALARQIHIYELFDSYSERSPSGNGLHIIVKGMVPKGRRRAFIELYSTERYMTMTGDIYGERREIVAREKLLQQLWSEMGGNTKKPDYVSLHATLPLKSDQAIYDCAVNARNGAKFKALWNGDGRVLKSIDKSPSAIDMALVSILQFYTKSPEQIERLWVSSPHGKRGKVLSREKYRMQTIARAFERHHWCLEHGKEG